jgi:hypothetical protein
VSPLPRDLEKGLEELQTISTGRSNHAKNINKKIPFTPRDPTKITSNDDFIKSGENNRP